eukprot:scaffold139_cov325-Pavlova_lutheri.AAC.23
MSSGKGTGREPCERLWAITETGCGRLTGGEVQNVHAAETGSTRNSQRFVNTPWRRKSRQEHQRGARSLLLVLLGGCRGALKPLVGILSRRGCGGLLHLLGLLGSPCSRGGSIGPIEHADTCCTKHQEERPKLPIEVGHLLFDGHRLVEHRIRKHGVVLPRVKEGVGHQVLERYEFLERNEFVRDLHFATWLNHIAHGLPGEVHDMLGEIVRRVEGSHESSQGHGFFAGIDHFHQQRALHRVA